MGDGAAEGQDVQSCIPKIINDGMMALMPKGWP